MFKSYELSPYINLIIMSPGQDKQYQTLLLNALPGGMGYSGKGIYIPHLRLVV